MAGSWIGSQFVGDDSNDNATGTSANESLFGNKGNDVLRGAGGIDYVDGGVGDDNLFGGNGNDILVDVNSIPVGFSGLIGHDNLYGGDGDDELRFQSADTGDFGYGGAGRDLLRLRFDFFNPDPLPPGTPITFTLTAGGSGVVKVNDVNAVAVEGIEYLFMHGWNGNDVLRGAGDTDYLNGLQGEDFLSGNGGDDTIDGGTGIQHNFGGAGFDLVSFDISEFASAQTIDNRSSLNLGVAGEITGFEAFDDIATGAGNDIFDITQTRDVVIRSGDGDDRISVADGGSGIYGGLGADTIDTGAGIDIVDGGEGDNRVHLGAGTDSYFRPERSSLGNDRIWGEDGNDSIGTAAGSDITYGGAGDDRIHNGQGNDTSYGGAGNDQMFGETGEDRLFGGLGDDVIDTDQDFWLLSVTPETDRAWGDEGNDTLKGGIGRDFFYGGDGDDLVQIGLYRAGNVLDGLVDQLYGGLGSDRMFVQGPSAALSDTVEVRFGPVIRVLVNGVEQAVCREFEAMTINAYGSGDQVLIAGGGDDSLNTGSGDDTVRGNGGNDSADTSTGSDNITLGDGNDTLANAYLDGTDIVEAGNGDDEVTVSGSFTGQGAALGGSIVDGGAGNDLLRLFFSNRPMQIVGNEIWVDGAHAADFSGFERLALHGSAVFADDLSGTSGADLLSGSGGNDTLRGAGGADTVQGGAGLDLLAGGAGGDTFAFFGTFEGADLIEDFAAADRIQVSHFGFAGLVAGGPVVLVSGPDPAATTAGGRFLFDTDDGRLLWDADGSGAGVAVLIATLENGGGAANLTSGQFLVV